MLEIMQNRHSVRSYEAKPVEEEKRLALNELLREANEQAGLHFQACYDEPEAFDTFMAHYGKFSGVTNYIALVAPKRADEAVGYWGEKIVLKAQELGLNTCWVAMTYGKGKTKVQKNAGEKIHCVLALGYGATQGVAHKIKTAEQVSNLSSESPDWFKQGVEAALLAPTAMNQQKFKFKLVEDDAVLATAGVGFYSKIDLGIAKYHFELGAQRAVRFLSK